MKTTIENNIAIYILSYQIFNQRTVTVEVSKLGYEKLEGLKLGVFTNYCHYNSNHLKNGLSEIRVTGSEHAPFSS